MFWNVFRCFLCWKRRSFSFLFTTWTQQLQRKRQPAFYFFLWCSWDGCTFEVTYVILLVFHVALKLVNDDPQEPGLALNYCNKETVLACELRRMAPWSSS